MIDRGLKLEIHREHQHPSEMFEGRAMPDRLAARLDNRETVTMTGLYRTRRSSNFISSDEEYEANLSFVGPHEFIDGPIIKHVTFRPSNEMLSVMYRGHRVSRYITEETVTLADLKNHARGGTRYLVDVIDNDKCQAFLTESVRLQISGHVLVSTNSTVQGQTSHEERQIKISYVECADVHTAVSDMISVCDFLSMMVGEVVSPLSVSFITEGELDKWGAKPDFKVYARWRPAGRDIDPQYGRRCLSTPMFDVESFQAAISAWIDRQDQWSQSYALATVCLANQRESSRRRFLDAAAWFESIPSTSQRQRPQIERDLLNAAADAAGGVLKEGGADVTNERLKSLLSQLNLPSLASRISDALNATRVLLGVEMMPASLDKLAKILPRVRGRFAHGEDAFLSDIGHMVHDATLLFEVLAATLSLEGIGLKISNDAIGHPFRSAVAELQQFGSSEALAIS